MLALRLQRTGRSGHAQFRVIVQDARRSPTSGKVVAYVGSYDPHAKAAIFDKEKIAFYLEHGAQPSDRLARLLKKEGVKLPDWVVLSGDKERTVRNADKRRSTRPEGAEPPTAEEPEAAPEAEATAEAPNDKIVEEVPAETGETGEKTEDEKPAGTETEPTGEPEANAAETETESPSATPEPAAEDSPADEPKTE
jgi:small subunit ribosomal protein S16